MLPELKKNLHKSYLTLFLLVNSTFSFSQTTELIPVSASVANTYASQTEHYEAFTNPASAALNISSVGASYQNNFLLNELSVRSVHASVPTGLVNIAASASYSGFSLYNELMVGVVFAREFGKIFRLGVQYNYYSVYMAESNKRYACFFPQIGTHFNLSPDFVLGVNVFNPMQQVIRKSSTPIVLPAVYSMGFKWNMSDDFSVLAQVDKNLTGNYRIAAGFEYDMKNSIRFKCGAFHNDYLVPVLGFGINLSGLTFNLNTHFHPVLGLQSVSSLVYQFHSTHNP